MHGGDWIEKYNRLIDSSIATATTAIEGPPLPEVKAFIATKKAEHAALYANERKKPKFVAAWDLGGARVDAGYLADFLAAMPGATLHHNPANKCGNIYIQDGEIEAILLPLRY